MPQPLQTALLGLATHVLVCGEKGWDALVITQKKLPKSLSIGCLIAPVTWATYNDSVIVFIFTAFSALYLDIYFTLIMP